jgi:hypothetical protein
MPRATSARPSLSATTEAELSVLIEPLLCAEFQRSRAACDHRMSTASGQNRTVAIWYFTSSS